MKIEVGGKEIKCFFSIFLDLGLIYEIIIYNEMLRILFELRRGYFDRFIMFLCYIGIEIK